MKPLSSWLDYLKVRASWGQNGNQNIAGFQYLSTISFSGADYTFGPDKSVISTGAYPDILANEDVTWETSEQTDLGIDARFLNGKLGLTFDYYVKTTKDWLVVTPMALAHLSSTAATYRTRAWRLPFHGTTRSVTSSMVLTGTCLIIRIR